MAGSQAKTTEAVGLGRSLSRRSAHLREASVLRTLTQRVARLRDGINLGQGVCELEIPDVLRDAAIRSIREERATYTPYAGLEPLREAIAARMRRRHGLAYEARDVVVTTGASTAMFSTLLTLLDPGDRVILFEPFYPYHRSAALLAGAEVDTIPLGAGDRAVDWTALASAIGDRTRILVLNTPANPHGKVWNESELERLGGALEGTQVVVVTDEIYEDLVYDGNVHLPPAANAALFPRTVTISGLSKAYSITGWRLGWLAAPPALSEAIGPVFDVLSVCAARPLQDGAAAALDSLPESYYRDLRDGYARRRDRLAAALRAASLEPSVPTGAYYMLADYGARYGEIPSTEASLRLLDELHLAAIPGEIFHAGKSPSLLRFHFAVEEPVLEEVERRLRRGRV